MNPLFKHLLLFLTLIFNTQIQAMKKRPTGKVPGVLTKKQMQSQPLPPKKQVDVVLAAIEEFCENFAKAIDSKNVVEIEKIVIQEAKKIGMKPELLINSLGKNPGQNFLHYACDDGDINVIRKLVELGGDVTLAEEREGIPGIKQTLLTIAVALKNEKIVEFILSQQKKLDLAFFQCFDIIVHFESELFIKKFLAYMPICTELYVVLREKIREVRQKILSAQQNQDQAKIEKLTTIQRFLIHTLHVFSLVLDSPETPLIASAILNNPTFSGNTPMHTMAEIGNPVAITVLSTHQKLFEQYNNDGFAPIHLAIETAPRTEQTLQEAGKRYIDTLHALITKDPLATERPTTEGYLPLCMALRNKDEKTVTALMQLGKADPDAEATVSGQLITPRFIATKNGMIKLKIIKDLIDKCTRLKYHVNKLTLEEAAQRDTVATAFRATLDKQIDRARKETCTKIQAALEASRTALSLKETDTRKELINEHAFYRNIMCEGSKQGASNIQLQQKLASEAAAKQELNASHQELTKTHKDLHKTLTNEQAQLREQRALNQALKASVSDQKRQLQELKDFIATSKTNDDNQQALLDYQQKLLGHIADCSARLDARHKLFDQESIAMQSISDLFKTTMPATPELSPPTTEVAATSSNSTEHEPEDQLDGTDTEQEFYQSISKSLNIAARKMRCPVLYAAMCFNMPLTIINYLLHPRATGSHNPYYNPLCEEYQGYTTFHWTVYLGYINIAHVFLFDETGNIRSWAQQIINRPSSTSSAETPLQTAITQGNEPMIQLLISAGALYTNQE